MSTRNPRPVVTFPIVLRELTVLRVADVTPGMRRVTLGGPQLRAFHRDGLDLPALRTEGFDDHVKFFFAEGDEPPVLPGQNVSSLDWPVDARPLAKDYTPGCGSTPGPGRSTSTSSGTRAVSPPPGRSG
ncbi:siderophore-interacting protein [Streptomyces microflavus]|uniref:siderophore-interacting protein n=1 Tax=Streptomyces microflavus TaxID=1919 RepID=UPI00367C57D8